MSSLFAHAPTVSAVTPVLALAGTVAITSDAEAFAWTPPEETNISYIYSDPSISSSSANEILQSVDAQIISLMARRAGELASKSKQIPIDLAEKLSEGLWNFLEE